MAARRQHNPESSVKRNGLTMADILLLPEDQQRLVNWMIRQQQVTLPETIAFLNQEETVVTNRLNLLMTQGFVQEIRSDNQSHYRVVIAPRRKSRSSHSFWRSLNKTTSTFKRRVFDILEDTIATDRATEFFQRFIITLIFLNVVGAVLATEQHIYDRIGFLLNAISLFAIVVFTVEYGLRVWTCTFYKEFRHPFWGRLRYMLTPFALIDLAAILPAYLSLLLNNPDLLIYARLISVLRYLRFFRRLESIQTLFIVLKEKRNDFIITFSLIVIALLFSSTALFVVERSVQPDKFNSIPSTMWWAVITLTSVGYGDAYPVTPLGKVLGGIVALLGVGIAALPAGILAAGFSEVVERRRNERLRPHSSLHGHHVHYPNHTEGTPSLAVCPHCGKSLTASPDPTTSTQNREDFLREWGIGKKPESDQSPPAPTQNREDFLREWGLKKPSEFDRPPQDDSENPPP